MNTETFFQQFELLADAPNGIQKLRELILQLAVQGKLVSQNPDDEPAAVLLERIKAEKKRLVIEKKIQKDKKFSSIAKNIPPWKIPESWIWIRLQDIFEITRGGSPRPSGDPIYFEGNIPWITVNEITKDKNRYLLSTKAGLTELGSTKSRFVYSGDILITNSGATLGVPKINKITGCINDGVAKLHPVFDNYCKEYIYCFLEHQTKVFRAVNQGMGQPNLNTSILAGWFFPLPPIAEQKRIVEKVDRLMELCDKLEAQQQQQQAKTLQLGTVATSRLTAAKTPEAFKQHWRNISNNFDLIYSTPENIKQLCQTILQLAVMGKLVPQNPDDEPAAVLLEKIKAEKEKLIKEGKIKKSKKLKAIAPDEIPFDLPKGWKWVKLDELSKIIEYGTSHKAVLVGAEVPVFRMNNIQSGRIIFDNLKYVPKTIKDLPRLYLNTNDILFNRTNSYELVGKTGVFKDESHKYTFASYLIRASLFVDYVNAEFINSAMNSSYFRQTQIEPEITQQCGQANFNGTKLKNSVIPLPPLAEQHRIVAKVNQLMTYCDELEAKLTQSLNDKEKLMDTAVYQLLTA